MTANPLTSQSDACDIINQSNVCINPLTNQYANDIINQSNVCILVYVMNQSDCKLYHQPTIVKVTWSLSISAINQSITANVIPVILLRLFC